MTGDCEREIDIFDSDLKVGETLRGFVRRYYRTYWGGRDVEIVFEDSFERRVPLIHQNLIDSFDRLEPATGDLIEIKRLPNIGRKCRYDVRILSRSPIADRSYTGKRRLRQNNGD